MFGIWNLDGWSLSNDENTSLRKNVINAFDCDIFAVCETFLRADIGFQTTNGTVITGLIYTPVRDVGQEKLFCEKVIT